MARRGMTSVPLVSPDQLVGQDVSWRPRGPWGRRGKRVTGRVESFRRTDRTLVILLPGAGHLLIAVPLASGPFTPVP